MSAALQLSSETTRTAFKLAALKLPAKARPRLKCECSGPDPLLRSDVDTAELVFKCRAPLVKDEPHFACGRWCCACVGGDDDNRCSECWLRRHQWLEQLAVRESFMVLAARRAGAMSVALRDGWIAFWFDGRNKLRSTRFWGPRG